EGRGTRVKCTGLARPKPESGRGRPDFRLGPTSARRVGAGRQSMTNIIEKPRHETKGFSPWPVSIPTRALLLGSILSYSRHELSHFDNLDFLMFLEGQQITVTRNDGHGGGGHGAGDN